MASSTKRTTANRENARRSTGPKTTEGKHRSRRNGITHGQTTTAMLLDDEDPEPYTALVEATLADLSPRSDHERALALNVANTLWRRDRLYRTETAFLNVRARTLQAENPDVRSTAEATAMLLMDPDDMNRMRLLSRYLNAAERACTHAANEYWSARNALLQSELEEARIVDALTERNYRAAVADFEAEENPDDTIPEPSPSEFIGVDPCPPPAPHNTTEAAPNPPCPSTDTPTTDSAQTTWKPFDNEKKNRDYVWLAKHGGLPDNISRDVLAWEASQ